jgi:hypothetical protein
MIKCVLPTFIAGVVLLARHMLMEVTIQMNCIDIDTTYLLYMFPSFYWCVSPCKPFSNRKAKDMFINYYLSDNVGP